MLFHYCFFVYVLIEVENGKNVNWEKYCRGKMIKFFMKFPYFYQPKSFSRRSLEEVSNSILNVKIVQTINYQSITFRHLKTF